MTGPRSDGLSAKGTHTESGGDPYYIRGANTGSNALSQAVFCSQAASFIHSDVYFYPQEDIDTLATRA